MSKIYFVNIIKSGCCIFCYLHFECIILFLILRCNYNILMKQDQPKRITYLFGAGASIGNGKLLSDNKPTGIPVVEKFNDDIKIFLDDLKSHTLMVPDEEEQAQFSKFKDQLNKTFLKFEGMYSFDTYAKSLFEKGEVKELVNLKLLLKAYLVYRQFICEPDPRYDLLFATLINARRLPPYVNFLSWNYDTQVELSLSKFSGLDQGKFLDFVQLGFKPTAYYKSSLLKLNGTVSIKKDFNKFEYCELQDKPKYEDLLSNTISEIAEFYLKDDRSYHNPKMYFSWENKGRFEEVLEYSKEIVNKTDILIVIGYSFPTLNRREDKLILNQLPPSAQIYVQCGGEIDFIEIKSKIESLAPKFADRVDSGTEFSIPSKVIFVPQNKEFYVPFEFEN